MKKTLITILATVLVCCCVVGGTLAWLVDQTQTVTNTFTVGKVDIDLTETGVDTNNAQEFKLIPGTTYTKDPTVKVLAGSETCYVFVKVVENNNGAENAKYVEYTIDSKWQPLDDVDNVYYYETTVAAGAELPVLTGNTVKISSTNVTSAVKVTPTLTFTAYAVQAANLADAAAAWTAGGFTNP